MEISGARCARGPQESVCSSIQIADGRVTRILNSSTPSLPKSDRVKIDLSGFLIMPGLVNAHDHLEFALFPRLADPPYLNYIDWGEDIHKKFPDVIAKHRAVPKEVRVWWGGIRNLLCGVTTVSHHNPLSPEMTRQDFPVKVVPEYGWGHSVALGGDLRAARAGTPRGRAFIVHACEGVDKLAREELWALDRLGLLDSSAVLVHGLAIDRDGAALMCERRTSLIVCPSSNYFLFGKLPDIFLLGRIENLALGNDSPLTAEGDLLDEVRFATRKCKLPSQTVYRMVTTAPDTVLRLDDAEGSIEESGAADLFAVRDTGQNAADRLVALSMADVERRGLEKISVDGAVRWLRAPVKELLRKTEEVLGEGEVRLGSRTIRIPAGVEAGDAC
jgi:cytosine/adenosine deaminase-related metal-dependent hydrolase